MKRIPLLSLCTFLCFTCDAQNTINVNWKDSVNKVIAKSNKSDSNSNGIFIAPIMVQQQSNDKCCGIKRPVNLPSNGKASNSYEINLTFEWIKQYGLEIKAEMDAKAKEFEENVNDKKEILDVYDKYLDMRENLIDRWLEILGIIISVFGIAIPLAGYFLKTRLVGDIHKQKKELEHEFERVKKEMNAKMDQKISEAELCMVKLKEYEKESQTYRDGTKGHYEESLNMIKTYSQKDSQNDDPITLNKVIMDAQTIATKKDATILEKYDARLQQYYLSNKYEQAIDLSDTILDLFSDTLSNDDKHDIYFIRGRCYHKLSIHDITMCENAIKNYTIAIEFNPYSHLSYNNRGNVHVINGDFKLAIEDYNMGIKLAPDNHNLYANRGNTYNEIGEYDLAIADYLKALSISPNDSKLLNSIVEAYIFKHDIKSAELYLSKHSDTTKNTDPSYIITSTILDIVKNEDFVLTERIRKSIDLLKNDKVGWSFRELQQWIKHDNHNLSEKQILNINNYINAIKTMYPNIIDVI